MVFAGLAVLLGSLAIFMTFLGLLNHLIYGTSAAPLPAVPDDVGPRDRSEP